MTTMDLDRLTALADRVLGDATIPELPNHYRGKVRDNYDLADGSRVIIASDRISAFDRILAAIPFKGEVLTQTARYWFEQTADICPNHVIAYPTRMSWSASASTSCPSRSSCGTISPGRPAPRS